MLSRDSRQLAMTTDGIRFSRMTRTLNGEKAARVLGYQPRVGMEEGIEHSVKWVLDNKKDQGRGHAKKSR